jgi:hypothetical protein
LAMVRVSMRMGDGWLWVKKSGRHIAPCFLPYSHLLNNRGILRIRNLSCSQGGHFFFIFSP